MKWRFFKSLIGGKDPDAERVYRWHIAKRLAGGTYDGNKGKPDDPDILNQYVAIARGLCDSMRRHGFLDSGAIPIDLNGELLGGAHRAACALALEIPFVAVLLHQDVAWAPTWDRAWFVDARMPHRDFFRMDYDWQRLNAMRYQKVEE